LCVGLSVAQLLLVRRMRKSTKEMLIALLVGFVGSYVANIVYDKVKEKKA